MTTTTGYRYSNFHHLHSNPSGDMEIRFRVMAKSDAHIALTTSPLVLNPLYEIVIGASGNNYTGFLSKEESNLLRVLKVACFLYKRSETDDDRQIGQCSQNTATPV